jgi:thiol:disulfide interchange protein DsbG
MRNILLALALAMTAVLTACDSGSSSPSSTASAVPAGDAYAIAKVGNGFSAGSVMASRVVYVFFDAQCPHCATLWESFKPLNNQLKVVWIPVGLLGPASVSQGAALLGSADPVQAMNEHEALLKANRRGMSASAPTSLMRDVIQANTKLWQAAGGESVPFIIAKHPTSGALIKHPGSLPEAQLRQLLGLAP